MIDHEFIANEASNATAPIATLPLVDLQTNQEIPPMAVLATVETISFDVKEGFFYFLFGFSSGMGSGIGSLRRGGYTATG